MKAAVFYETEDLRLEDVSEPEAGPDEVVVKVLACGFCGSDIEYYYGRSPLGTPDGKGPLVLGHEICGQVVQAGKLAEQYGLAEGDRVALNPVQSCNACNSCRSGKLQFCQNLTVLGVTMNGGFAEYVKTKIAHAYKLPESLTDEQGAFVEMLSSAVYSVQAGRDRARELRRRLRPGTGRALDGAAPEERGRPRGADRDSGLQARARQDRRRRLRLEHVGRVLTALRRGRRGGDQGRERRRARRSRPRRHGVGRGEPAGDRDLRQRVRRRAHGPRRPRRRGHHPVALEPLPGQDDPLLAALSAPVAEDDPHPRGREGGHREDHHPLGDARGDRARDRAGAQPRRRGHQDRDQAATERSRWPEPKYSVSQVTTFHLRLRRGHRRLPEGRRRGHGRLGVQAARERRRELGREAAGCRDDGDDLHPVDAVDLAGPVPGP